MPSLLVTNDFPPKIGGIQSYLWELWRRQDPDQTVVLTTPFDGDDEFDSASPIRIIRTDEPWLRPTRSLQHEISEIADRMSADLIILDPLSPLGSIGPDLDRPYVIVLHGAEVNIPSRIPGWRGSLRRTLESAGGVISAGRYALEQAERLVGGPLPHVVIPPGVDVERFHPVDAPTRSKLKSGFGMDPQRPVILGASRLVPRKGFDVLIDAAGGIPDVQVLIVGDGRDRQRLESRAASFPGRIRFTGPLGDDKLVEAYQAADIFAMPCRNRWLGLEQEGFGIVYLEAAATGIPAIAGRSGGTAEAVVDGETGSIVDGRSVEDIRAQIKDLVGDPTRAARLGGAARDRVLDAFSYDVLASRLAPLIRGQLMFTPDESSTRA